MIPAKHMHLRFLFCLFVLVAGASANAEKTAPVIREGQTVLVDAGKEHWRLQWEGPTTPVCSPDKPDEWPTCPCSGFAFGECGKLALVRKRPGKDEERLALNNLFQECIYYAEPGEDGEGCLRRWDVQGQDWDDKDSPDFTARVRARPIVQIMHFADYDHDGRATEFMLQIGDLPCGKRMCVVIGISRKNSRLHVFASTEHPKKPLVLQDHQWKALLRSKGPVKVPDWRCGDHGADEETELELRIDHNGNHAMKSVYECTDDGIRGRFLRKCILRDAFRCEDENCNEPAK